MVENTFDFHVEAAEIKPEMVQALTIDVLQSSLRAKVHLVTLEQTTYEMDWTTQNGLQVLTDNGEAAPAELASRAFEDLNQFLQGNSQAYQGKFNDQLMAQLMDLASAQGDAADRFRNSDVDNSDNGEK